MYPEPEPEPQRLIEYYRDRVNAFESEREDLLKRITICSTSASESHTLRCEAQTRAQEVRDLQQALSAAHVHLFEERERFLRLQAQNDELKLRDAEQRQRIQHLVALTGAVDQDLTFAHSKEPCSGMLNPRHLPWEGDAQDRKGYGKSEADSRRRILRTVYLPSTNTDALQLKVESLQAQLDEQQQLASERVNALLQDRKLRDQDEEAHRQNYQQHIETLTTKVRRLEEALRSATTDYILARRDRSAAEERATIAETSLSSERKLHAETVGEMRQQYDERLSSAATAAEAALDAERQRAARAAKARDLEAGQITTLHAAVKAQLEARVAELEGKLAKARTRLREEDARRSRSAEGAASDVALLRKQLAAVERRLTAMRLQARLADDERLDKLLDKVARMGPKPPQGQKKDAKALKGHRDLGLEANELEAIRNGLLALENNLVPEANVLKQVNRS